MPQRWLTGLAALRTRVDWRVVLFITAFFLVFFGRVIFAGRHFVGGDSLTYSYPLRYVAWDMIRHGQLPLWTPLLLSGYPLLSMAQLAIGYPLTWFYLLLPGYVAEEIYVYAPFLLSPLFAYAYLRGVGCSRMAGLLGGLSFGYGGMMAGGLSHNGMFTNAVMWLPLFLLAIERVRQWPFGRALAIAGVVYGMAVLTGLGQGFLYSGIIALAYAFCVSLTPAEKRADGLRPGVLSLTRWQPLLVALGGIVCGAGLAAFQILETMRAQRRSIRSALSYEVFSGGSFTAKQIWKSFALPLYNFNYETTTYVPGLAGVCVLAALIWLVRHPRRQWRVWFWLGVALAGFLLIQGDGTSLYRVIYRLPLVNLFRIPWRHAFELTLGLSMLGAFGWDAARVTVGQTLVCPEAQDRLKSVLRNPDWLGYSFLVIVSAFALWAMATGFPPAKQGDPWHFTEAQWAAIKAPLLLLWCALVWWGWTRMSLRNGRVLLLAVIFSACFWEQQVLMSHWCFPFLPKSDYFTTPAPSTKFMQQYEPTENRVFTSTSTYFNLKLPLAEPHNISMIRGLHNAAGYEPLLPKRYADAFGSGLLFNTPTINAPLDPQILQPSWQVLDLLNVRLVADYSSFNTTFIEREDVLFPVSDSQIILRPGNTITLSGSNFKAAGLTIVTTLANAGDIPQGETVAHLTAHTNDGRQINYELKAGVDTAEWAHERADVKPHIKHGLAKVFDQQVSDGANSFPAYHYWTNVKFDPPAEIDHLVLQSKTPRAELVVWRTGLYSLQPRQLVAVFARLPEHWRKVYDQEQVQIFENARALPRLWLTPQAEAVSPEEALKRIRGESTQPFDPRRTTLLETVPVGTPAELRAPSDNQLGANDSARFISYEPNHLQIETNTERPAVLVVSEAYYPGWAATIDGQETALYAANYLLRGILLPAGKHRVELWYRAPAARSGAVISFATAALLLGLFWKSKRKEQSID
jgi:hypothetical protein